MKKLIYSAAALSLAFFAASCQQENLEPVETGSNTVTYSVQVPDAIATKVIGEKDADIAAVNELVYAVYRTEATVATDYDAAETKLFQKTATITNGTATVSFELVNNQNFRVLFWAQVEGSGIYSTGDLKNVTLAQALSANAEAYAAFAGSDYIKSGDDISGRTITLKRPVSQLNIATTPQSLNLEGQTDVRISTTAVTVNGLSNVYNVATGLAEGQSTEFVYDATNPAALSEQTLTVNGTEYKYISMNYVGFAGASDNASVTYHINTENVGTIFNTIDNVPFKANYRTNIIGNLITSTSDYVIELDRNWAGEFISASNASEFADALANAQSGDIVNVAEGEYDLPASLFDQANSGTFTIAGSGAATTVMNGAVNTNASHPGNYAFGKHIVLKDLTYVTTNNGYNGGFGHAASVTFINCTIKGQMYAHSGAPHYFYDCTIDPLTGYLYTYASDCVFERCTFTASEGKALQIYSDGTDGVHSVTIKDCDFVAAKQALTGDGKPVTGIDINSNGAIFNVTVEDCTTTDFPTGLNSNSDLYNIKDGGLERTNLVVDGVVVNRAGGFTKLAKYPNIWVNDNNYYVFDKDGLAELNNFFTTNAWANHLSTRSYNIGADIDANGFTWNSVYVVVGNNANNGLVIDGNGHTISNLNLNGSFFTGTPNGANEGTTPGYVKNITIDNANVTGDHHAAVFWGETYGELVYENVTVKNTSVVANCNVGVFVGSTYEDGKGIDNILFKNCKVENCSIVANGKDGQDPTGASVFCGRAFGKTNLTFEGSTVDSATKVENKNGLVGGMYGYTTWYGTGFVSTGASDEIVNWNGVQLAAVVGGKVCKTLADAAEAAKAGDTIQLIDDTSLSESLTLPAGVILDGNGKQINGSIVAGGDLTFVGHTKVTGFSASYYNRNITISQGACLEVTGAGRVSLAYGNTFNVTGNITDAKTIDKSTIKPSLIIPAGISITGGNDATINVTDAYVQIGSTTSKPGAANGTFTLNITNSIAEFTNELGFYEPTGGVNPTFNLNLKNSVLTTGTKMCIAAPNTVVSANNSTITIGTSFRNSGYLKLDNKSSLTGNTTQHGENSGNTGVTEVDNQSKMTITAPDKNHPLIGETKGKIKIKNQSEVSVTFYKSLQIENDGTGTFTGTEVQ